MLTVHLLVVVTIAIVFSGIAVLTRKTGPAAPLIAFVSWLSVTYQSIALELQVNGSYQVYTGASALALYFLALAGIMFIYFVAAVYDMIRDDKRAGIKEGER